MTTETKSDTSIDKLARLGIRTLEDLLCVIGPIYGPLVGTIDVTSSPVTKTDKKGPDITKTEEK